MSILSKTTLAFSTSLLALGLAMPAVAQVQDEVIVTATKRAENIQDVPISITAYGAEFIEKSGVNDISDVALYTPNFTIGSSSKVNNARIAIRGVGSVGDAGIEPSVGVFVDGVYYPRPGAVIGNLMDIQSFEVLRGPQGTLFGRNTPMGALNITTKDPSFAGTEGSYELGYGAHNAYKLGAAVNIPLGENTAMRIAGKYTDRDGYGTNLLNGQNIGERTDFNLRGKLLFEPTDALSVKFTADYGKISSGGAVIEYLNDTSDPTLLGTLGFLISLDPTLAGVDAQQLLTSDPYDQKIYQDHRDSLEDNQWGISSDISYDLDSGHTFRAITSYRDWHAESFESAIRLPIQLFPRITEFDNTTFAQEIQLLSPTGGTFDYLLGAFYYDETYHISQDFNLGKDFCAPVVQGTILGQALSGTGPFAVANGGPGPLPFANALAAGTATGNQCDSLQQIQASDSEFDQDLKSYAVYAQGTYHASEQLSFTLGGRYTKDKKTADFRNKVNNPFVIGLAVRADETHSSLSIDEFGFDDARFTYFANTSYKLNPDTMLFATMSSGFKSGGFNTDGVFVPRDLTDAGDLAIFNQFGNGLTRAERIFGPEDTTNYEVGVKTDLADGALRLNATLYRMDIDGYQDRAFDGISFLVRNVGSLRQQGFEADATWQPIDQLKFIGGMSYLDSEFTDFVDASPLPGEPLQVLTGQRAHYSPKWQYSLVSDWSDSVDAFGGSEYFLRGEVQHIGEQNIGAATNGNPQSIQDPYSLFNARIGLRSEDDRWEISLWGKNLTDKGYCMNIYDQPFGAQLSGVRNQETPQRCAVGAPQTYGVELKFRH